MILIPRAGISQIEILKIYHKFYYYESSIEFDSQEFSSETLRVMTLYIQNGRFVATE